MSEDQAAAVLGLAERFFAAIEGGDIDAVRVMYAPDAVIWHNFDQQEQSVETNLVQMGWIAKNFVGFRYEQRRCLATETGFVEQHLTCGRAPNGHEFSFSACIVCTVVDGKITRVDEYLDSAQVAPLMA